MTHLVTHFSKTFPKKYEKQIKNPGVSGGTGVTQLLYRRVPGNGHSKVDIFKPKVVKISSFASYPGVSHSIIAKKMHFPCEST